MKKLLKNRFLQFGIICLIFLSILVFRLANLTVEHGQEMFERSTSIKTVEIDLKGSRGMIYDRNNIPMAINQQIYNLQLDNRFISRDDKELNAMLLSIIDILNSNGDSDSVLLNSPLRINEPIIYYEWKDLSEDTRNKRYKRWTSDIGIKGVYSADDMFELLRDRFEINEDLDNLTALKIITIRLNILMNRYHEYKPVVIASDVSDKSIVQLNTYMDQYLGLETVVDSKRYYPMGDSCAHIIGHTGTITDKQDIESLKQLGYDISIDKIGRKGVESYAEEYLTGCTSDKHGFLKAEVSVSGKIVNELEKELPQNGDNVVLTIDSNLQKAVEDILEEEVYKMSHGITPYDGSKYAPIAKDAGAVILDVHTGEVLAMASYPSYDLNLFVGGISTKEYDRLRLNPVKPLRSEAFQEVYPPGSIFKMFVGMAGLMEDKITLNEQIYDAYRYNKYSKNKNEGPRCWANPRVHKNEDLIDALKHSCDYYFYELADRLGIDTIAKWGNIFGINGTTGLEISGEAESTTGSKVEKPQVNSSSLQTEIKIFMQKASDEMKKSGYKGFLDGVGIKELGKHIEYLSELDYSIKSSDIVKIIRDELGYLNKEGSSEFEKIQRNIRGQLAIDIQQAIRRNKLWLPLETVTTGIGQSFVRMTPLNAARYIASIVNGGEVLNTHVIKQIETPEGKTVFETKPKKLGDIGVDEEYIEAIKIGMHKVVYDKSMNRSDGRGTAVSYFEGLDPSITLAGKTGTAQTKPVLDTKTIKSLIENHMDDAGCFEGVNEDIKEKQLNRLANLDWAVTQEEVSRIINDEFGYFKQNTDEVKSGDLLSIQDNEEIAQKGIIEHNENSLLDELSYNIKQALYRQESSLYNVAWFASFTPYENPEVAVVVCIPDGRTSSNAALTARRIIEKYYSLLSEQEDHRISDTNILSK